MPLATDWTEVFETVVVLLTAFGAFRHIECKEFGCHRFALKGKNYCHKHIGDERTRDSRTK